MVLATLAPPAVFFFGFPASSEIAVDGRWFAFVCFFIVLAEPADVGLTSTDFIEHKGIETEFRFARIPFYLP